MIRRILAYMVHFATLGATPRDYTPAERQLPAQAGPSTCIVEYHVPQADGTIKRIRKVGYCCG